MCERLSKMPPPDFGSSQSPKQAKRSHSQYPVTGWKHIRGQFSVWLTYCVIAIFNGSFNYMEAEPSSVLWPYCYDEGKICKQQQKKIDSEPDRLSYVFLGAMVAGPVGNSELRSLRYLVGTVGPKGHPCSKHLWLPAIWTWPVLTSCLLLWSSILAKNNWGEKGFIWVTISDYTSVLNRKQGKNSSR